MKAQSTLNTIERRHSKEHQTHSKEHSKPIRALGSNLAICSIVYQTLYQISRSRTRQTDHRPRKTHLAQGSDTGICAHHQREKEACNMSLYWTLSGSLAREPPRCHNQRAAIVRKPLRAKQTPTPPLASPSERRRANLSFRRVDL